MWDGRSVAKAARGYVRCTNRLQQEGPLYIVWDGRGRRCVGSVVANASLRWVDFNSHGQHHVMVIFHFRTIWKISPSDIARR